MDKLARYLERIQDAYPNLTITSARLIEAGQSDMLPTAHAGGFSGYARPNSPR